MTGQTTRRIALESLLLSFLCLTPASASDTQLANRVVIEEVFAGANGDSRVQFVELSVPVHGPSRRDRWKTGLRAAHRRYPDRDTPAPEPIRLTLHDATGNPVGSFDITPQPTRYSPGRLDTFLIATIAFEQQTGLEADLVIPSVIPPVDGMVCVHDGPRRDPSGDRCLAYGNYRGPVLPDPCGGPDPMPAPALQTAGSEPLSLSRFQDPVGCFPNGRKSRGQSGENGKRGGMQNDDFQLAPPSPLNRAGETTTFVAASLERQGENLFRHETFNGNGRTCLSCHIDGQAHGLTPAGIDDRFAVAPTDALFVAEHTPPLAELENACLMRGGNRRGLILENVDGFSEPPVFRGIPHLLNLRRTAPYGLSGQFADLRAFSRAAVEQHFPKTLARNPDPSLGPPDFRLPNDFELDALEAFMSGIEFPADGNLSQPRMMDFAVEQGGDRESIERGRLLVGGTLGKAHCFRCHGGPTRSLADGSLGTGAGSRRFDTGVSRLAQNDDDGCAGGPGDPEPALPAEDGRAREFDTPPLIGVARTAPFFHDNSVADLRDAVAFYASDEFASSPAGQLLPDPVIMSDQDIDDIVAFLEAISIDPSVFPQCDDGIDNDGDGTIDAGGDPGCVDRRDDSERELGLPCDDGIDNDGDRLIDFGEDPDCERPTQRSESR